MREIVVASGKGGTGKTSLVGAFAELSDRSVLADCDVDAANLHLIVQNRIIEKHDFIGGKRASINMHKCTACNICIDNCRFDAIGTTPDTTQASGVMIEVDDLACEGCGLCARLCPTRAVDFKEVINGQWYISETTHGPFLHARLGTAESNSGKLVSLLRQKARELASDRGIDLIIIDGPPGIGCPTIATLTNASFLLIVTEPSLSAIHDMDRVIELASHFGIGTGICINRYDINTRLSREIERSALERGIPILGKILYDPAFTQAQLEGVSYLRFGAKENIETIENIWHTVYSLAESDLSGGSTIVPLEIIDKRQEKS